MFLAKEFHYEPMECSEGNIDHTLLKAEATKEKVEKLCEEAKEHMSLPRFVLILHGSNMQPNCLRHEVKVCTVIGFPLGANTPEMKTFETENAIENGAQEVDMVINIGASERRR